MEEIHYVHIVSLTAEVFAKYLVNGSFQAEGIVDSNKPNVLLQPRNLIND